MREKIKVLDILILLLALKFMFSQWHIQIIFYIYFSVGLYLLYDFVRSFIDKTREESFNIIKIAGVLVITSILAFSMHYYRLTNV